MQAIHLQNAIPDLGVPQNDQQPRHHQDEEPFEKNKLDVVIPK